MYGPDAGLFIFYLPKEPIEKGLGAFLGCRNPDTFKESISHFWGSMIVEVSIKY